MTHIYIGIKREIIRRTMIQTEYFADEYEPGKDFCWERSYSQDFLKRSENSRYSKDIRNLHLISLFKD